MPYLPKQHRLFEFVAHNPAQAHAEGIKIPQADAARMASEGVKKVSGALHSRMNRPTGARGGYR